MKIYGVIAEYNPFHNGHKYLIDALRDKGATHIVAVMSGNFVQRGESALFSKWARAEMALKNGVDLVLELPLPWSSSNAQSFAEGGVSVLNSLGCVDCIGFGSECGDTSLLQETVSEINKVNFQNKVLLLLKDGLSYPAAFGKAAQDSQFEKILGSPNDTLAVEYIKALRKFQSNISPDAIRRIGNEHDSDVTSEKFASATYLREKILKNGNINDISNFIPKSVLNILSAEIKAGRAPADMMNLEKSALSHFRRMKPDDWKKVSDVTEGLENRLFSASQTAVSLQDFYEKVKTKRYSMARIRRTALHAFLDIPSNLPCETPPYLRVLGFNAYGAQILKKARNTAVIPIIHRAADVKYLDEDIQAIWNLNSTATDLFSLAMPKIQQCGMEYTQNSIRF